MRNVNERKSPFSTSPLHCEVALGLKMQSYSCDGVGGPFFSGLNNQPHFYELGNGVLVHRSLDTSSSRPSGMMPVCGSGKALFTSSQLQELERQKIIHKYISASIPVPPQLLSTSISPPPSSLSQCNMELRYSSSAASTGNGSDPEPWRCKRTDGKKWRCSRDVAPDLKYCERHAHKNRPRSRKHVETPKSSTPLPISSSSSPQFPYHQSRCIEWLTRGGRDGDGSGGAQLEQLPSSKNDSNLSVYHPHFAEKNDFDHGMSSERSRAAATRLFIDAWGKEGMSMNRAAEKKVWPSSSLSLRMGESGDDKGDSGIFKNQQWPNNPISWLSSSSSAPGGPLGEALCLGNGGSSLVSSPHAHSHSHGYSNSNTNSSSKSSCEDGSHALNFIG